MFDEGSLKSAQRQAQHVVDSLMADMLGKTFTKKKIRVVQAHDDIFRRVSEVGTNLYMNMTAANLHCQRAQQLVCLDLVYPVRELTNMIQALGRDLLSL